MEGTRTAAQNRMLSGRAAARFSEKPSSSLRLQALSSMIRPAAGFPLPGMAFLDNMAQEVLAHPPAPVPKRVKPVAEEPKKTEAKKGKGDKAAKAEKSDDAKGEKKPAAKKGEGKKAEKPEGHKEKAEGKKPEA